MRRTSLARGLAGAHAVYLLGSGLWPVVHRRSFEDVTGPKRSFWLVRLVGGLTALQGAVLAVACARGRRSPEARTLALGSVRVFGLADLYAARRHSRVYLADAVLQSGLAAAWGPPVGGCEDGARGTAVRRCNAAPRVRGTGRRGGAEEYRGRPGRRAR